ncbi:hypothetical protein [Halomarina oriensis]|uniref:Uncharacterized protein n=1 Tax=Halomarina oriensis TaxID=671145 RepID=A0A6B0GPG5_9EURY|nr:hypothetical protein [Halomarina oriensis]MWG35439.1 hypothetical protein [Halomarina oriensis]
MTPTTLQSTATLLQVSGTDLVVVALLAFACFGLPGIAAMLYLQYRSGD